MERLITDNISFPWSDESYWTHSNNSSYIFSYSFGVQADWLLLHTLPQTWKSQMQPVAHSSAECSKIPNVSLFLFRGGRFGHLSRVKPGGQKWAVSLPHNTGVTFTSHWPDFHGGNGVPGNASPVKPLFTCSTPGLSPSLVSCVTFF